MSPSFTSGLFGAYIAEKYLGMDGENGPEQPKEVNVPKSESTKSNGGQVISSPKPELIIHEPKTKKAN